MLKTRLESPLDCKEIQPVQPKENQSWMFIGKTDAEAETPILWPPDVKNWLLKRPWCWERWRAGGEGDDRGWDGILSSSWMASPTQWTWVRVNSGSWWWTGRPGVLQSMQSQSRTRLSNWIELTPQQMWSWEWLAASLGLLQSPLALAPRYCPLLVGGFDKVKNHILHEYKKPSLSPLLEEHTPLTDIH